MGFLAKYAKIKAGTAVSPLDRFPSGAVVVNRAGAIVATTLPAGVPRELVAQIGQVSLRAFAASRKVSAPLTELITQYEGLKMVAIELRGGALIYLNPGPTRLSALALPPMSNPSLDDQILFLETYVECWKQFHYCVGLARKRTFNEEEEAQFLELKSLMTQGLESILDSVDQKSLSKEEILALINNASSLGALAENEARLAEVEGHWHRVYISLQSLLGRLKVQQQNADSDLGSFGRS